MKTFRTMLKTELKLSLRGMDMLIFAIFLPLAVLFLLGMIYGNAPAVPGADDSFVAQSFGALTTISICAGGVMGLPLVVSDYRSRKILKRFQVTPIRPALLLLVQVVIYALYAVASLLSLWLAGTVFFGMQLRGSLPIFLCGYLLVMCSMFSVGMAVGGVSPDTKTASVIACVLYFPMLLFSGATLPYEILPGVLQKAADLLPLTQGIKLLKSAALGLPVQSIGLPVAMMAAIAVCCIAASLKFFRWE